MRALKISGKLAPRSLASTMRQVSFSSAVIARTICLASSTALGFFVGGPSVISYVEAACVEPNGGGATTNSAPGMLLVTLTSLWLMTSSKVIFPALSSFDVLFLFFFSFRQSQ